MESVYIQFFIPFNLQDDYMYGFIFVILAFPYVLNAI